MANLAGFDGICEAGHVLAARFDPLGEAGVGHLLSVGKGEPRIQAFESGPDLLSRGFREMTRGAMLVKEFFARNCLLSL